MIKKDERLLEERLVSTKDKLIKRQRKEIQMRGGRPYYPVSVFLIGEKAFAHFLELRDRLQLFWPAYMNLVRFFYIDDYTVSSFENIYCVDMNRAELSQESLTEAIDSMYSESNEMQSSSRLLTYVIYDSGDIKNKEEVQMLFSGIDLLRQTLCDMGYEQLFAVFHLLNERGRNTAGEIKKKLKNGCCREKTSNYILSNHFQNNRTLISANDDRYRLIASIIVLSDDGRHNGGVYHNGKILTVKYSKLEKDYNTMATALVETLLRRICVKRDATDFKTDFVIPDDMRSLLGLSDNCKFNELERIVNDKNIHMENLLPYLPRESEERFGTTIDMNMTEREIDDLTMGGWSASARMVSDNIVKEVNETVLRERIKESYSHWLKRNMNVYQLAFIKNNYRVIQENIDCNVLRWDPDARLGNQISQVVLHYVAVNDRSDEIFMETIRDVSDRASKCVDTINELLSELATIPEPRDSRLYKLVCDEVNTYVDTNEDKILQLFRTVDDSVVLQEIDNILESIIQLPIFSYDMFGLVQKMVSEDETETGNYIWRRLHTELLDRQYMSTITGLTMPELSMVITKKDTKLAKILEGTIGTAGYELYDFGIGDVIESIEVYIVDDREIKVD